MKVTLVRARLCLETPGGVTGTETRTNDRNRLRLRRTPDGTVHLPGTTVAGSLRAHCRESGLDDLFGDPWPKADDQEEASTPSAIQVVGTVYRPVEGVEPQAHARTSIDRFRGAARVHTFHNVEQLPPGTEFDVMLRWNDPDRDSLNHFLRALTTWHPRLGRGVTSGSGRCALVGWGRADYDLDTPEGLLAWLRDTGPDSFPEPTNPPKTRKDDPFISVHMSIVDALLCFGRTSTDEGGNEYTSPYRSPDGSYWIPGSTLKGVLRSRAEYICRVTGADVCDDAKCGQCLPCTLFGYSNDDQRKAGAVIVESAPITKVQTARRPHVAIDRFTGGARDEALYRDEVLVTGQFPLVIRRRPDLADEDVGITGKLLLKAVIADLDEGLVGIGSSTTAGYGTVRVTSRWNPDLTKLAPLLRGEVA